jgi:hypothetical protein
MMVRSLAGVVGTARMQTWMFNTGDLSWCQSGIWQPDVRSGLRQESEGLMVPSRSVKAGGGTEPWFRVRLKETRVGRLA